MPRDSREVNFQRSTLAELRGILDRSPRAFSLCLAVCSDDEVRDYLIRTLRQEFDAIAVVTLHRDAPDPFADVKTAAPSGPSDALFVAGLDRVIPRDERAAPFLAALNASPKRWKAWYGHPIVFWVHADTAQQLRQQAPDFWEWQSHLFLFDPA